MAYFRPTRLSRDATTSQWRRDARLLVQVVTAQARGGTLPGTMQRSQLKQVAQDDRLPVRTRRRAAELLLGLDLTGRERPLARRIPSDAL